MEERVEFVQDSKEGKLSSHGDSEEAESSSLGTKTDSELIEKLLPGVYAVIAEYFKQQEKLLVLMSVHFTSVKQVFPNVVATVKYILNVWSKVKLFLALKEISLTATDEVEERVDTVGNLGEDESSSVGDSEEDESDPRVQQEVGDI